MTAPLRWLSPPAGERCSSPGKCRDGLGNDYATVAYNAATGARLWVARYNGPGNRDDGATSVAVAPSGGTVYVTGSSVGSTSQYDYATVAYNAATGAQLWVKRYNGPSNGADFATSLAIRPSGGTVYVTGSSAGTKDDDYATVAYNAVTGARQWVTRYNGPRNLLDFATSLAVSPRGDGVRHREQHGGRRYDYATVAYNAATGRGLWVSRYNGPGNGDDGASSVAVSPAGSPGVRDRDQRRLKTGTADYATVAYSAATGRQLWASRYRSGKGLDKRLLYRGEPSGGQRYS